MITASYLELSSLSLITVSVTPPYLALTIYNDTVKQIIPSVSLSNLLSNIPSLSPFYQTQFGYPVIDTSYTPIYTYLPIPTPAPTVYAPVPTPAPTILVTPAPTTLPTKAPLITSPTSDDQPVQIQWAMTQSADQDYMTHPSYWVYKVKFSTA